MTADDRRFKIAERRITIATEMAQSQFRNVQFDSHLKSAICNLQSSIRRSWCRCWSRSLHRVSSLVTFDATGGVNQFLLAGKKRVAGRTDFNLDFIFTRTRRKFIATGTMHFAFNVFWMDSFFHFQLSFAFSCDLLTASSDCMSGSAKNLLPTASHKSSRSI